MKTSTDQGQPGPVPSSSVLGAPIGPRRCYLVLRSCSPVTDPAQVEDSTEDGTPLLCPVGPVVLSRVCREDLDDLRGACVSA